MHRRIRPDADRARVLWKAWKIHVLSVRFDRVAGAHVCTQPGLRVVAWIPEQVHVDGDARERPGADRDARGGPTEPSQTARKGEKPRQAHPSIDREEERLREGEPRVGAPGEGSRTMVGT